MNFMQLKSPIPVEFTRWILENHGALEIVARAMFVSTTTAEACATGKAVQADPNKAWEDQATQSYYGRKAFLYLLGEYLEAHPEQSRRN